MLVKICAEGLCYEIVRIMKEKVVNDRRKTILDEKGAISWRGPTLRSLKGEYDQRRVLSGWSWGWDRV